MKLTFCNLTRIIARICFLFLSIITISGIIQTVSNIHSESVTDLNHVWTDETGKAFQLNHFQKPDSEHSTGQKIYYTISEVPHNTIMMFRCRNMFANVYLDDSLVIYHLKQMTEVLQKGMQADMLHKLALTDHLTGLYNRTAFAEHQEQFLETMIKESVLGIIQFDVNNLKTVNDTLGHEKGDYLIQLVSEGLSASFSETGYCYRMGGDEFLVILTGKDPQKDYECGMRMLHTYCAAHNLQKDIEFPIVIAHGFVMEYGLTLSEAIEKADVLMYENKKVLKFEAQKRQTL